MTKIVMRNAMGGILPEKVRMRADKMGFVTPESVWFKTIFRRRIEEILESREFSEMGYFNTGEAKKDFERFCRGDKEISLTIWRWLNLVFWTEQFMKG
jgi:asparagine synthase (glutamine-hydrolysing)